MIRHYCTYLDHNYVPRVLVMADSLRRHAPGFRLHVLCLSELCARMLADLAMPELVLIPLADLERRYPALLEVKPTRSRIGYYFTLTPFLPAYCLDADPQLGEITYLDSDLCFFADPQAIFDVIGTRAIGIVPHRLTPGWDDYAGGAGHFNVGWITYRRTEQGLGCLDEYRADCLDWCSEIPEGGKFADQTYLDRWPSAFSDLAIIDHKGVNAAVYNIDSYAVDERDGRIWCDEDPLIFYHFHGIYQDKERNFAVVFPNQHGAREGTVLRRIYRPYLGRLIERRQTMLHRFPEFRAAEEVLRAPPIDPLRGAGPTHWAGDPLIRLRLAHAVDLREQIGAGDWSEQPDARAFVDLADLLADATADTGRLSVLDWGGGFGELHWCARATWPTLAIDWHVRELAALCDHAAGAFPETRFHDDDAQAFAGSYDVALAVGALHHAENWHAVLAGLAAAARRYLVIVDLPMSDSGTPLFIQERPLGFLPDAVFVSPVLPTPTLLELLDSAGWERVRELPSSFAQPDAGAGAPVVYRSLVFRRVG